MMSNAPRDKLSANVNCASRRKSGSPVASHDSRISLDGHWAIDRTCIAASIARSLEPIIRQFVRQSSASVPVASHGKGCGRNTMAPPAKMIATQISLGKKFREYDWLSAVYSRQSAKSELPFRSCIVSR